jgi:chromosome segregation ATPase
VLVILALLAIGIVTQSLSRPEAVNAVVKSINASLPSWLPAKLPGADALGPTAWLTAVIVIFLFFGMGAAADRRIRRAEKKAAFLESWIEGRIGEVEAAIGDSESLALEAKQLHLRQRDFQGLLEALARLQTQAAEQTQLSIEQSSERRTELEQGLTVITRTNEELRTKLVAASGSFDLLHEQIGEQREALEELQDQRQSFGCLGEELTEQEGELAKAKAEIEALEKLSPRLTELKEQISALRDRCTALAGKTGLEESLKDLREQIEEVTEAVGEVEECYDGDYSDLDGELDGLKEKADELVERLGTIDDYVKRVESIRSGLAKLGGSNGAVTEAAKVSD